MSRQKLIIILGPTASGKSDLAVWLAKKINGEIISADSRQIYKSLDIGTGKITKREMKGVPHYCLDSADPKKQISVAEYQICAEHAIQKIISKKKIPILVGGSGMYSDAVMYGAPYPNVPSNRALRARLEKKSAEDLFRLLRKKDPARAKTIDQYNKRRVIRALEIIAITKKPIPPLIKVPHYSMLFLGIKKDRKSLEKRIDLRLKKRLRHGMVREVKNLMKKGISSKRLYDLGLEYRYISEYLRGKYSKKEMVEKLSCAIKQYAKRQMTWFRQYPKTHWIQNKKEAFRFAQKFIGN
jgi:tRNA dimethylallyltransferase